MALKEIIPAKPIFDLDKKTQRLRHNGYNTYHFDGKLQEIIATTIDLVSIPSGVKKFTKKSQGVFVGIEIEDLSFAIPKEEKKDSIIIAYAKANKLQVQLGVIYTDGTARYKDFYTGKLGERVVLR